MPDVAADMCFRDRKTSVINLCGDNGEMQGCPEEKNVVQLPGDTGRSLMEAAYAVVWNRWGLGNVYSHNDGNCFGFFFQLKRLLRNQFALDGAKFLKFISDSPITHEQWADNYIHNN